VEDHRLGDIETGHLRRGPTSAFLQPGLGLKEASVAQVRTRSLLALVGAGLVGREEVAHLEALLDVGHGLAVADLDALANGQLVVELLGLEHPRLRDFQRFIAGHRVETAALSVPDLRIEPAHAPVEIDDHLVGILLDDGEGREDAAGRQVLGHHQAVGGLVQIDAVVEELELHDLARQSRGGRGQRLRNPMLLAEHGARQNQGVVGAHADFQGHLLGDRLGAERLGGSEERTQEEH